MMYRMLLRFMIPEVSSVSLHNIIVWLLMCCRLALVLGDGVPSFENVANTTPGSRKQYHGVK